jgi:hypothetical protein
MYVLAIASMWCSRHATALSGDLDGTARFMQMCRIANVLGRGETRGAARVSDACVGKTMDAEHLSLAGRRHVSAVQMISNDPSRKDSYRTINYIDLQATTGRRSAFLLIHTHYLGDGSSQGHCQLVGLRNAISLNQSGPIRAQAGHTTGRFVK